MRLAMAIIPAVLVAFMGTAGAAQPPAKIRVLIVTGNDYPGHKWRQTTPVVRKALEDSGRFEVKVAEDPEIMSTGLSKRYDVVVLHYCNWESPSPSREALEGLASFVRGGGGLVALHFACGAFLDWPEYEKLIGRIWDQDKTHDPRGPFKVEVAKKDHPITRGLEDFDTVDELYFCLKGKPKIDVLLTAQSKVTKKDEPMGFVLNYGKGRVFQTVLGHDVKAFSAAGVVKLLRRSAEWAASGAVAPPMSNEK